MGAGSGIEYERVALGDVTLQVTTAGPRDGHPVLLIHGFPELAYSWRHQITGLADAGYRVIAPDMRGYGASDCPTDVEAYGIFDLVGDVVDLAVATGAPKCTLVGHDWGGLVAWAAATFRPDLWTGVASLSVPYAPSGEASIPDALRAMIGPDGFHYIVYFQELGPADTELDADPLATMRRLFWTVGGDLPTGSTDASVGAEPGPGRTTFLGDEPLPEGLPSWLSDGDLAAYASAFMRTGFTGGINWYRNMHRNWERMRPWRDAPVTIPALFVCGDRDPVLTTMAPADDDHPMLVRQAAFCPDLRVRWIEGAGHWVQQERPAATSAALLEFLAEVA